MERRRRLGLRLHLCLTLGCLPVGSAWAQGQPEATKPFFEPFGLDLSALDVHTRPQDDFYQYVNGSWIARTQIPADKDQVEETGNLMQDRVDARIRGLLETAAAELQGPIVTPAQKVGAMYAAYMDTIRIDAIGDSPIEPELKAVRLASGRGALARLMGQSFAEFGGSIFAASINIDFSEPTRYAVYLNQAGLGMPDRRYYLLADFARERRAYQEYVLRLLELIKWPNPITSADRVVRFETRIAQASWSAAQQRDAVKSFNPMSTAELTSFAPRFPWAEFLAGAQLGNQKRVIVGERSAFPGIARVFADTPLENLKAWFAFNVADRASPYLSKPFAAARFEFRGKALEGRVKMLPRWRRGVLAVSGGNCVEDPSSCFGTLGFLVGQMYVGRYFPNQTKARVEALVVEMKSAYRRRIEHLSWMSPATKQEALRKLAGYNVKVGFPEHPSDDSAIEIRSDDLAGDVRRAAAGHWNRLVGRSSGSVDWSEWTAPPQVSDEYNGFLQ